MDLKQLHTFIVQPTLATLGLGGKGAERMVLATGLIESRLQYISQVPSGVAKGIFQMEKATHDDIWQNFLSFKAQLKDGVNDFIIPHQASFDQLCGNLYYATAMCRIHYLRQKAPLPSGDSLEEIVDYWKQYYNTPQGAGNVQEALIKAKDVMDL